MDFNSNIIKLLFYLLCVITLDAGAQHYTFSNFNNKEIISSAFVYKTFEDSKGYLWFLTDKAVTRYDGQNAKLFGPAEGYNEGGAFHIAEGKDGKIWVLTINFRLYYFEEGLFHHVNSFFGEVAWFYIGPDDKKWVITKTRQGLYTLDGRNHLSKPVYLFPRFSRFHSFIPVNDSAYLFSFTNNVSYFCNGKIKPVLPANAFNNFVISRFFRIGNRLFITTYQGIYEFINQEVVLRYRLKDNNQVFDMLAESDGIWLATERGLILLKAGNTGLWHTQARFLNHNAVLGISKSRDNLVWASTASEGIYTFKPETQHYPTGSVMVTYIKNDGERVYGFTETGNYYTLHHNNFSIRQLPKAPDGEKVKVRYSRNLSDTQVFACANRNFVIQQGNIRFLNNKPGSICAKLRSYDSQTLMVDSSVNLRNQERVLVYRDEWVGLFNTYSEKAVVLLDASPLLCIKDTFYYISDKGLVKVHRKNGKLEHLFIPFKGIISNAVYEKGVIYLTTTTNGLYLIKNDRPKNISTSEGLISNYCSPVLASKGYIWVGTNKGMFRLDTRTGYIKNFTAKDYLADEQVNDITVLHDTIYIATNSGITCFPEYAASAERAPEIYLEKLLLNNSIDLVTEGVIETDYLNDNFTLQLTSPGYRSGKLNRFRLVIANDDELDTFYYNNGSIQLLALMPGRYNIQADVMNIDGIWSKKPVLINLLIHPPFWKTTWFISLVIAIICGVTGYVIWISVKRQRDVQEYNRKIVESELKSLRLYMNPHFLFNSLTSLQSFILTVKTDEANYFITKFSKLIRAVMNYSVKGELLLKEEIQLLNNYIELESVRFGSGFTYEVGHEPGVDIENIIIPSLLIQPFVENSIKHGVTGISEHCYIKVWFEMRGDALYCIVTDNGKGRNHTVSKETTHISSGIKFTEERIKLLLNKKEEVITISDNDPLNKTMPGTRVEIHIPILNDQTDD